MAYDYMGCDKEMFVELCMYCIRLVDIVGVMGWCSMSRRMLCARAISSGEGPLDEDIRHVRAESL